MSNKYLVLSLPNKTVMLKSLRGRYPGGNAIVVASGPTKFDYADLSTFDEPVFFVNDAVRFECYVRGDSYLVTCDSKLYAPTVKKSVFLYAVKHIREQLNGEIFPTPKEIPANWTKIPQPDQPQLFAHPIVPTAATCVYYNAIMSASRQDWEKNKTVAETGIPKWAFDKDQITRRKALFGHTGAITHLIHLLWYMGISSAKLVGCRPLYRDNHQHDPRIQALSGRRGTSWILQAVIPNQIAMLQYFGIVPTYFMDQDD